MKRKITGTALVTAFLLSSGICVMADAPSEAEDYENMIITDAADSDFIEEYEKMYAAILDKYAEGQTANWDTHAYEENGLCYIYGFQGEMPSMGYCFADVNRDGIMEMLTGFAGISPTDPQRGYFYELFTLQEGKPVKAAEGKERYRFALCDDGTISACWSGGAAYSGYDYSVLSKEDTQLETYLRIIYDSDNTEQKMTVFKNEVFPFEEKDNILITMEEANQIIGSYQYLNPEFRSITEYVNNADRIQPQDLAGNEKANPYDAVLEEYFNALQDEEALNAAGTYDLETHKVVSADVETLKSKYPHVCLYLLNAVANFNSKAGYAYYDIDRNGTDELLIAILGGQIKYYDMFTSDGTNVYGWFTDVWEDDLSYYYPFENGNVLFHYQGDAADEEVSLYRIADDGYSREQTGNYYVDRQLYPDTPYYNDEEKLSDIEFSKMTMDAGYISAEWIPF